MVRRLDLSFLVPITTRTTSRVELIAQNPLLMNGTVQIAAPPFGMLSLTCSGVEEPVPPDEGHSVWALSRPGDGRLGYLLMSWPTALRIVAGTMGIPASGGPRALGSYERGIVTAFIAGGLRAADRDAVVLLGARQWRGSGLVRLTVTAIGNRGASRERILLDVPPDWIPAPSDEAWVSEITRRGLEITLGIDLARTTLTACDWANAQVGDAVVFDDAFLPYATGAPDAEHAAPVPAPARPVLNLSLACGLFSAQISAAVDGSARLITDFSSSRSESPAHVNQATPSKENETMAGTETATAALTMLAAAPIEVVAEIGRIVMRADEVAALRAGSILELGPLSPQTVELRVGGRSWASGELVDVDGKLGVRLTAISPGANLPERSSPRGPK